MKVGDRVTWVVYGIRYHGVIVSIVPAGSQILTPGDYLVLPDGDYLTVPVSNPQPE